MSEPNRILHEKFYAALQAFGRIYTFRDPTNACLFDLRVNECYVLDYLAACDGISVSNLAAILGIHKSNASRIAMALQDQKLVESAPNGDDGRSVILKTTALGRARHAEIKRHFVDRLETIMADFSQEEILVTMTIIKRLTGDAETRIIQGEENRQIS